jgi:hypothetical protein
MAQSRVIEGTREDIRAALDQPEMEGRRLQLIVMPDREASSSLLDAALQRMANRSPNEISRAQRRALDAWPPPTTLPPGKTVADVVAGQWPGEETDEQVQDALTELS